ncbi:MAG: hypothetical protein ACREPQ_09775 [Rhodanobacter sp.]
MNDQIYSSEAIRQSDALCLDVKASNAVVVLGVFIGEGEAAVDLRLSPTKAAELRDALTSALAAQVS